MNQSTKTIDDLRAHLFDVIERIKPQCGGATIEVKQAEAVCLAAKRLLESAAIELEAVEMMGGTPSSLPFFEPVRQALLPQAAKKKLTQEAA